MTIANIPRDRSAHLALLRAGAGLAVALWGVSKLAFAADWVAPYGNFYPGVPTGFIVVYVLGIVQLALGAAIMLDVWRRLAAWVAVAMSLVNLLASLVLFLRAGLPLPAPLGLKLVWFFFNPLALTFVLAAVALMPRGSEPSSETRSGSS